MEESPQSGSPNERVAAASSGTGALHLHEFRSLIFLNKRILRVWVPPGYDAPENAERHYPVFYLNDGQNLFDPERHSNLQPPLKASAP